jgi:uncharacterized protein YbjT (DUF2867 family)
VGAYFDVAASISDIRLLLKVKSLPKSPDSRRLFIAGGTGYIGSALLPILLERGHRVRVLARPGSKAQLPAECEVVSGNLLDANSYRQLIRPADTFIHLVGVVHPSRAKSAAFRAIDLVSTREAVSACGELGVQHFVYLSVAHPAPFGIMKNYIAIREECERMIEEGSLNSTIVRPWYVLGPGRRWPYLLLPFYKVCEWLPFTRSAALRLGLVTLDELILALIDAVESPAQGTRIVEVPDIRNAGRHLTREAARKTA